MEINGLILEGAGARYILGVSNNVPYYRSITKKEWKQILKYFRNISKMDLFELNKYLSDNEK